METVLENLGKRQAFGFDESEKSFRPGSEEAMNDLFNALRIKHDNDSTCDGPSKAKEQEEILTSLFVHLDYAALPSLADTQIEHLRLTARDVEDLEEIANWLKRSDQNKDQCKLKTLDISGSFLADDIAALMGSTLECNTTLETLILSDNDITTDGALLLAQGLRSNTTLKTLDLRDNCVGEEGGGAIAAALQQDNTSLEVLLLSHNEMGFGSSMSALNTMVRPWEVRSVGSVGSSQDLDEEFVSDLHSDDNNCYCSGDEDDGDGGGGECDEYDQPKKMYSMAAFGSMLRKNRTLRKLDLAANDDLISSCAIAIAKGLEENTCLQELRLDSNPINTDGVICIAQAVQTHAHLKLLSLEGIMFDREAVYQMAQALQVNQTLEELNLNKNMIETTGAQRLAQMLEANTSLRILRLKNNDIDSEGAIAFGRALLQNTTLQELELDTNQITDQGGVFLGSQLPHMKGLQRLTLGHNENCTFASNDALEEGLWGNMVLEQLELPVHSNRTQVVRHVTLMNKAGRRLLQLPQLPAGIWPYVFERCSKRCYKDGQEQEETLGVIFGFVQELPNLVSK